jgi:hypothetical protein
VMKMETHCYYAFYCVTHKVEDLCICIYIVIFDTIAMINIFCTMVLSVIQGVALITGVLPLAKCRALHCPTPWSCLWQPLHQVNQGKEDLGAIKGGGATP